LIKSRSTRDIRFATSFDVIKYGNAQL